VIQPGRGALSAASGRPGARHEPGRLARVYGFVDKTSMIVELEAWKLRRDPTELLTRAIQPVLWLVLFGEVFSHIRAIPTGNRPYLDFMAPGILAQSVLFVAIFYGISAIWERDLGVVHKLLVTPTPRSALILGKALSAGLRGLSQAVIIYVLAVILGVHVSWNQLDVVGVLLLVLIGAGLFSTFSLIIATVVKTRERFMGIGQVLTMPLFFASNAIYPISIMPAWLQAISRVNPLSYEVDGLRTLMLAGGTSSFGLGVDFAVLIAITSLFVALAGRLYPHLVT
jgi:ABC-2 type transport system permease protein